MAEFVFADDYVLDHGKTRSFFDVFMKGLVHKNNNLMGVVQGFGSLILADEGLPSAFRDNMEQMDAAARTATELNKRVLTAAGCARVDADTTSLSDLFPFLEDKATTICEKSGVELKFSANPEVPQVILDYQKFTQIYEELVANAAEAAAATDEKTVVIDVFCPGEATSTGNVDFFIRNASPVVQPHQVQEFYESFRSTKGSEHFGIGLTIAAVLCGQMSVRLGLRYDEGVMTAWMAIPTAKEKGDRRKSKSDGTRKIQTNAMDSAR